MTRSLERAISEVQKLSAAEQDAIAALILEELADERRWDQSFSLTQDNLTRMANKARDDIRQEKVKDAGMDAL